MPGSPSEASTGSRATQPREDLLPLVPHLRAYARSLVREPQAADDLVQDTLVRALQAWDRFEPGTNLKAWLFRILHNRFHTVVSRRHVKAEVVREDLELLASTPAEQEFRAELPGFKRAFARLAPQHREVLVLYAVNGLAYEQIAEICGCNIQAVKSRMNRARTALKRQLGEDATAKAGPVRRPPSAAELRVLVVEDEALIAMDIGATLRRGGYTVVGPARCLDQAARLAAEGSFDVALLDINLAGEAVFPVAEALAGRGVPFMFLTVHGRDTVPERFRDRPLFRKPYSPGPLLTALGEAIAC